MLRSEGGRFFSKGAWEEGRRGSLWLCGLFCSLPPLSFSRSACGWLRYGAIDVKLCGSLKGKVVRGGFTAFSFFFFLSFLSPLRLFTVGCTTVLSRLKAGFFPPLASSI